MESAYLASLAQEISEAPIAISQYYQTAPIFDQLVKFAYAGTDRRLLVAGDRSDGYFGVQIRNILREECGIRAPMIDIDLLHHANIAEFDEVIVCYNKWQVQPTLEEWRPAGCPPLAYLDDIIARHFWLLEICDLLAPGVSARDVVRALLGEPVEHVAALQFDGLNALRQSLRSLASPVRRLLMAGSGAGLLPLILREVPAASKVVYESDVKYRQILHAAQAIAAFEVAPEEQFLHDLAHSSPPVGDGDCVIYCDMVNRIADPTSLAPYLAVLPGFYATMFLSCETKPHQNAIFRKIGQNIVAFGRAESRDLRCYGQSGAIWLPREKFLPSLFAGYTISRLYQSDDQFADAREFGSGYLVLWADRA